MKLVARVAGIGQLTHCGERSASQSAYLCARNMDGVETPGDGGACAAVDRQGGSDGKFGAIATDPGPASCLQRASRALVMQPQGGA